MNRGRRGLILAAALTSQGVMPGSAGQAGPIARIAYLGSGSKVRKDFIDGLHAVGRIEGQNLLFEARFVDGDPARVGPMTKELLTIKPDVFVSDVDTYARAAAQSDADLPVVFIVGFDPVGIGLVRSLARPGGRVTGISVLNYELGAKRLSLLREAVPRLRTVGVMFRAGDAGAAPALRELERAGHSLGLVMAECAVRDADDLDAAFERMARLGVEAFVNVPDIVFLVRRAQIAELALRHRMPSAGGAPESAEAGYLLIYGTDLRVVNWRAARLVDRILKGADPANLPVEQADAFELIVNRRTARALHVEIPSSLLLQATRVID